MSEFRFTTPEVDAQGRVLRDVELYSWGPATDGLGAVTVNKMQASIPMTAELLADCAVMDDLLDLARKDLQESAAIAWRELELDAEYGWGTRHHPDRNDWWRATRADRVRRNIRRNLPPGRPGRFVRCTSGGDLG